MNIDELTLSSINGGFQFDGVQSDADQKLIQP